MKKPLAIVIRRPPTRQESAHELWEALVSEAPTRAPIVKVPVLRNTHRDPLNTGSQLKSGVRPSIAVLKASGRVGRIVDLS